MRTSRASTQLVDELLAFWSLEDYEGALEELEEGLIAADFGPKTATKISDALRDRIKGGSVKSPADVRRALREVRRLV